ncbi:MAG: hypothetical protein HYV07_28275 [Deltaproteobacteria bacterium]|nr:hypothetical protein [Deltaproteobacteria bacterium]
MTARPEDVLLLWYGALGRREAGLACSSSTGARDETWRVGWAALELVRADR